MIVITILWGKVLISNYYQSVTVKNGFKRNKTVTVAVGSLKS